MLIRALAPTHLDYPARLLKLRHPPNPVYIRGVLSTDSPTVAMVGSRVATEKARRVAREFARQVAEAGVHVVSGGARGIDAAAHRGALDGGGLTTVVLPGPVDRPTPLSHRRLFARIGESGGVFVSERDRPPRHAGAFCARNRIIAALADVVLVVQAGPRSGTRHTVAAARRIGVPVAAVPWDLDDPRAAGCLDILRDGGATVTNPLDLMRLLGVTARRSVTAGHPEDPAQRRILDVLHTFGGVARTSDLLGCLPLEADELLACLAVMDLDGWVIAEASGVIRVHRQAPASVTRL